MSVPQHTWPYRLKVGDFNENHDEKGQFSSGSEGGKMTAMAGARGYPMSEMAHSNGERQLGQHKSGALLAVKGNGEWSHSYGGGGKSGQGIKSLGEHLDKFHHTGSYRR